nr:jerky protein homolog-like [Leptinotarsa decemlineata]
MRVAAEQFAVPFSTLNDHFHGRHQLKYGRPPALDANEERLLSEILQLCANWEFPLKPIDIKHIVKHYLSKRGLTEPGFIENLPGTDWFNGFMKRNPNLTIKLAENTKRVRAALSYESVEDYFRNLKNVIKNIPYSNIINYDETNFVYEPGAVKVVLKKGTKHAHRAIDSTKTSTTVIFAISGDGTMLPPYIVYKAKHLYVGWTEGGIEGARYNRTLSGRFDSTIFEDWFYSIALPHFKKLDGDKVLIGDNLSSHVTVGIIRECKNNNIRFVLLPPNSTHLLQPLDVAFFDLLRLHGKRY